MKKLNLVVVGLLLVSINCGGPKKEFTEIKGIKFKGNYNKSDTEYFLKFFEEMRRAVENKDAEKAFSFYSKDFMSDSGIKLSKLKKNTEVLYKSYDNFKYEMNNIKVTIKDDRAITIDEFFYSANPIKKGLKPLRYKGVERIYWKKENNEWKIINWVFED